MTHPPITAPAFPAISGYTIVEQLYLGTRTAVYRAVQKPTQRPVVIKVLRREYPSFSELVQFRNQYTIVKNLPIPGIVCPLSLDPLGSGYALVMEDCGGVALSKYIQQQALNLTEVLTIMSQIADILDGLCQHRVVHKDIKPANILIHPESKQVKLIDFSIASLLSKEAHEIQSPNVLEGTLAYLAPEQTGRMNRGIDYRADFYALGVTLYELLTGMLPFTSDDPLELMHCHIAKMPVPVDRMNPDVPSIVAAIVAKLMAKNAEDRYQSAVGLKHDLAQCLIQWKETGKIIAFELGQHDLSDRFLIPEKLYGREGEVQVLLDAFERVASGGSELMLVAGFSGIGKTAVVNEVHKPIVRERGYFVKGKFDQFNRNIPLSAFVQALRDLMGQLLSESDAQLSRWRTQILAAVGAQGQVLINVIPELEPIIGAQPIVPELSGSAAQNRFNLLFQKFIEIFTTVEHPLVLFLDDLQWADAASLQLIELLMNGNGYLLVLGAYRDNEVPLTHPLSLMVEELKQARSIVQTIRLTPLTIDDTNQLMAETLNCALEQAQPLTELIHQKTQGNPFFTTQFLKVLHEEGLIRFDYDRHFWECDMVQVQALALTDDVVEFMVLQLQKLPVATQKVLRLAACIGNQFDLATLAIVSEQTPAEAAAALWKALQEGFILPTSQVYKFFQLGEAENLEQTVNPTYRFLHDRVQQAAYYLIPEAERVLAHYQIGKLLRQQLSAEAREDRIFEVVNQLNQGVALIEHQSERDDLIQLNLAACQKARSATAYQSAYEHATIGLMLLGDDAWQEQYELALQLYELGAGVAALSGNFNPMNHWIDTVIHQAKQPLEQVGVYLIRIQTLLSHSQYAEAISTAQLILKALGVEFPQEFAPGYAQEAMQEIKDLIGDRSIDDLLALPKIVDAEKVAIAQIVAHIMAPSYLGGSQLFPLVVALAAKISLQYGCSPTSAYTYAGCGLCFNVVLADITTAAYLSQLAYRLDLMSDNKNARSKIRTLLGLFLHHRQSHLRETLPIHQEGYQAGLESGDLVHVGHNSFGLCLNAYWCGQPLIELESRIRAYRQQLLDFNQIASANYCTIFWEATLCLLNNPDQIELAFEHVDRENSLVTQALASNDLTRLCFFYLHRATLRFLLKDTNRAAADMVQAKSYILAGSAYVSEAGLYFYDSLIALAIVAESSTEMETQQQRVQENQIRLQFWAEHAPMNHLHKWHLVEAEKHRVLDDKAQAIAFYDRAITGAKENGYRQEEALANELAAEFYLNWGKVRIGQEYLAQAYYGYAHWGAQAKIQDLERRYPDVLTNILHQQRLSFSPLETAIAPADLTTFQAGTQSGSLSTTSISATLDLETVLKASQTLSGEIQLDRLLAKLLHTVLENAGADKGALLMPRQQQGQQQWFVEAIATAEQEAKVDSIALSSSRSIPHALINMVKRSQKPVVIGNATAHSILATDAYIIQQQPKSLLCTPILQQGKLVAILYLENQLTLDAFTSDRVELLNFLCAQAAISLENARLYQQAQSYTQQLEQSQLQIVQSEKMASLGNLVAGVAHEINNPIGFLNGSIKNTKDYMQDLLGHLALYQQHHPDAAVPVQENAEAIDLEFLTEDLLKLLDSMKGASDRIKGISKSLRTFSRADTEHKVSADLHDGIDSTLLILKYRIKGNDYRPEIKIIQDYGDLPSIECFPGQLNQVFMNILANAIDVFDEAAQQSALADLKTNPQQITIQTRLTPNMVEIGIRDNGKGMSDAVKAKIFDHLFTTKEVGKGTGLGLAIARQIVLEKHGGSLEVQSVLGEGTEFCIRLPIEN
jgi:predicted ATPase/signal transduction histidine kinase